MAKSSYVLCTLGVLIFGGWAAHYFIGNQTYAGLACSHGRVSTFGWTHTDRARAELAAILRWSERAKKYGAAYTMWHNAQERFLTCRRIGGPRGHFQCRIAATPCKLDDKGAGA